MPTTYKHYKDKNGNKIQVESAIRDGSGKNIENNYSKQNGFYEGMGVGNATTAEQLHATVGITDKAPYNFRTAGGSADIGNRENDKIVGGTIAWNQLNNNNGETATISGVTFTNNGDGSWTVNGTATDNIAFNVSNSAYTPQHKYVLIGCPQGGSVETYYVDMRYVNLGIDTGNGVVLSIDNVSRKIAIRIVAGTTLNNLIFTPQLFDLTQMFGSTIADYIYSLEQATAGAGVAWFKNLFPKPYYEYNAGELMSVCTNAHITRGFNAWDGEKAIVIGGNEYYVNGTYGALSLDGEEITVTANKFTPAHNGIITASSPSATLCINLSWSGYRNGEYEPYVEHRYPLSPVELRGIPKLDSAKNLYFDGDTYEKDGTVTRRYGIVDLGASTWRRVRGSNEYTEFRSENIASRVKLPAESYIKFNAICKKDFVVTSRNDQYSNTTSPYLSIGTTGSIRANYVGGDISISDFVAYLQGNVLVYELATPTTETANPFTDPQEVDDFGTEEYVDALATAEINPRDVEVPVGHETFYQVNLRDKLQNLPENANTDGLYLVKQTGNKQELIAYTPEIPSVQSTGTYILNSVDGVLTWKDAGGAKKYLHIVTLRIYIKASVASLVKCIVINDSFNNLRYADLTNDNVINISMDNIPISSIRQNGSNFDYYNGWYSKADGVSYYLVGSYYQGSKTFDFGNFATTPDILDQTVIEI